MRPDDVSWKTRENRHREVGARMNFRGLRPVDDSTIKNEINRHAEHVTAMAKTFKFGGSCARHNKDAAIPQ
jgi:hypothetical protein